MTPRILCTSLCVLVMSGVWAQSSPAAKRPASSKEERVSPELIDIAQRVHVGKMPCELGTTVQLTSDATAPGYFQVNGQGQGRSFRYRMKAVTTSTGAIDEGAHPEQVAFAQEMIKNPPPSLIDTTGMGR